MICVDNDVVGKKDTRQSHDDYWRVITFAASKLESVCTNIYNGNITLTELRSIKTKQKQMKQLCEVTELAKLQKSMRQRLAEFKHFEAYKMKLEHLLFHIGKTLTGKMIMLLVSKYNSSTIILFH